MTNTTDFTAIVTDELTRAFDGIKTRGVSSYTLARQDDGSVEAFASGIRVNGTEFWSMSDEVHDYDSAEQYLEVMGAEMRNQYANPAQD